MTQLVFTVVNAFTSTVYCGNPLAIVRVPQELSLSQDQKQRIARQFNLSETVFLHEQTPRQVEDAVLVLDIFTSHAEIPFAGHPTVGTANYCLRLLDDPALNKVEAFQLKAGRFELTLDPDKAGVSISLAHNVHIHASPFADRPFAQHPVVSIVQGMTFILAQLPDLKALGAQVDELVETYTSCEALDQGWRQGLVGSLFYVDMGATAAADGLTVRALRTRMFASREDPATGSAASALASYLSLATSRPGRYRYAITQGVEMGQKSDIHVQVSITSRGPGQACEVEHVWLSGSAVQVMEGTLQVPE